MVGKSVGTVVLRGLVVPACLPTIPRNYRIPGWHKRQVPFVDTVQRVRIGLKARGVKLL